MEAIIYIVTASEGQRLDDLIDPSELDCGVEDAVDNMDFAPRAQGTPALKLECYTAEVTREGTTIVLVPTQERGTPPALRE